MPVAPWLLVSVSLLVLAGCQTVQPHERALVIDQGQLDAYLADKPASLHRLYARVLPEGERNAVLNHMRIGVAALELNENDAAGRAFDEALNRIEAVYADNPQAEAARSLFVKENAKDFKGEPYERAMAYYYRGLLYLREGDYENARASFRGGMLQDTLAADERYNADFASLAFLEGWSSHCLGKTDAAKAAFDEASRLNPELAPPAMDHNLLLIAETGGAPVKERHGKYGERMVVRRSMAWGGLGPLLEMNGEDVPTTVAEDIYWQASTRGGRQVDAVLDGKAQFKGSMDAIGNAAVHGGMAMMDGAAGNHGTAGAGLALGLAGIVMAVAAEATTPQADLRYWDNLPEKIHIATMKAPDPLPSVQFRGFNDFSAVALQGDRRCTIGWAREFSALSIPDSAPNAIAKE